MVEGKRTALLEAKDLRFGYASDTPILQGVDLDLHAGEMVALFGPNGAGKSTLLKVLGGLLKSSAGDVRVAGQGIENWNSLKRAQHMARMPQGLDAWPDMKVGDLVRAGRYCHRPARSWRGLFLTDATPGDHSAVQEAMRATGTTGWRDRSVRELSGGERERVLMARALAQGAPILLADEPTRSLDPAHQLEAFGLLKTQAGQGKAVLVVTHDWNLASQFADRLVCLAEGRIVAQGTPSQVLRADVLGPVFGSHLHFGSLPAGEGGEARPFVLPWSGSDRSE